MSIPFVFESSIVLCIAIYSSIYLRELKKGNIKPVLATWILFSVATVLSFVMNFFENGIEGIAANFFNMVDTIATLVISVTLLFHKNIRKSFTVFEKKCFGAVVIVFFVWMMSGQNVIAHLSIQGILVIAYLPTLFHLWNARENTESLSMWFFNFLASFLGTIEPLKNMAFLPLVYGIRATVSTLAVILFVVRLQYRKKRERIVDFYTGFKK